MHFYIPHYTLDQPQEAIKVVEWEILCSGFLHAMHNLLHKVLL